MSSRRKRARAESGLKSWNFPMCWDGKNTDSSDHKSHVAFPSEGPDKGDCTDPKFPVKLPRIFMEMYWSSPDFKDHLNDAMNPEQPFVFSNGDPTGYGYHGDFVNGWDRGVLQKVVDNCSCDPNGSLDCCAAKGIFTLAKDQHCRITKSIDEPTTGTLPKLPGNNPVQKEGKTATKFTDSSHPQLLSPVYVYRGDNPDKVGKPVSGSGGNSGNDQTAPPSSDGSNDGTQQGDSGSSTSPTSSTSTSSPTSGSNGTSGESQGSTDGSQQGGSEASAPPTSPTSTSSPSGTSGESQGSGASGNGQDGGTNQSSGSPAYPPAPGSQQGNSDNGDAQGSDGTEGAGGSDNHSSSPVTPPTSTSQDDNHSGVYTGGNASEGQTNSSQSGSTSKTCSRKKKRNTKKRSPRGRRHFHESAKRFDSQQF
ncbi:hypothetical protein V5O48_003894 [Marasmius crinis-equi]|uniref:DUF1996 domain-containing protein n=1 Tax=Marasmius crinis-equi TaxID=585013 RepID=A0ABR3FSA4_9AGAR